MKNLLSILFLFPFVCLAQTPPNFIPRVNATNTSAGTNTHLQSPTIISPLRLDIPSVLPTTSGNLQFLLRLSGNSNLLSSSLLILDTATGALIGNGSGLTNLPASAQTPWNQDVDTSGFNMTNSTLTGFLIYDVQGNVRVDIQNDGAGNGTTRLLDSIGSPRLILDQGGDGTGSTTLSDPDSTIRFLAENNDANGSGDTWLKDGTGTIRFLATQNGMSVGSTSLYDAEGGVRIEAVVGGVILWGDITNLGNVFLPNLPSSGFLGTDDSGLVLPVFDGFGLTNILEKNVVVTTNGWGNSVIDFTLGTQIDTNLTSNLTLSGIDGFVTSNLNWQVVGLLTDGSIRTVTVPASFHTAGFTAKAAAIPANSFAKLTVEALIGLRTNATIEIFTP